jgi:F0F1-type ATP synthase membrane subunit c/vacuolar-type H+-ATPase subunit K
MYSDKLLKMLESRQRAYKVVWLMLPLQIFIMTMLGWAILRFAYNVEPLKEKTLLHIITVIFSGITLAIAVVGIKLRSSMFNFRLDLVDSGVDREFASATIKNGIKSLSHTELLIYKTFHSMFSRVILFCGFFEIPVIFGLVLALLSGSLVYCLAGSLIGLFLWKFYIPSPGAFRREFFAQVDAQLKNSQKPAE